MNTWLYLQECFYIIASTHLRYLIPLNHDFIVEIFKRAPEDLILNFLLFCHPLCYHIQIMQNFLELCVTLIKFDIAVNHWFENFDVPSVLVFSCNFSYLLNISVRLMFFMAFSQTKNDLFWVLIKALNANKYCFTLATRAGLHVFFIEYMGCRRHVDHFKDFYDKVMIERN